MEGGSTRSNGVFRGIDTTKGKGSFVPAKKRDTATLLPIIEEFILPDLEKIKIS